MATQPLPVHQLALNSYRWFAELPDSIRDEFAARARQKSLSPGDRLFARGDAPDGIYYVVSGALRSSGVAGNGRETVLDFFGPGVCFGEVAALDGDPRTFDTGAYTDVVLLHLGASDLEDMLAAQPLFSRALLRLVAVRLRLMMAALEVFTAQPLDQRLATRLLMLSGPHGVRTPRGTRLNLKLPQETLAELIGGTRQRVNHILHRWEAKGILKQHYGDILIRDPQRLEKILRT